jgi:Cft2 family RNA processing exonuclease
MTIRIETNMHLPVLCFSVFFSFFVCSHSLVDWSKMYYKYMLWPSNSSASVFFFFFPIYFDWRSKKDTQTSDFLYFLPQFLNTGRSRKRLKYLVQGRARWRVLCGLLVGVTLCSRFGLNLITQPKGVCNNLLSPLSLKYKLKWV